MDAVPRLGEPLPNTEDTRELLRLWEPEIEAVASEARVPVENLRYRVVKIMHSLARPDTWSAEGERGLRYHLEEIHLQFPYRRPRSEISREAIFYAVAELVDAGRLSSESLSRLEPALRFYDPSLVLPKPREHPSVVGAIPDTRRHSSYNEEWVRQAQLSIDRIATRFGDYVVLAEDTTLIHLDWGRPTELRKHVMVSAAEDILTSPTNSEAFFEKTIRRTVSDYSHIRSRWGASVPLVVQHASYGYDTPAENWLALNPLIGHRLGWAVAADSFFRWLGTDRSTMVQSLWWVDGLIEQWPPHFDDEVGEGWLVIASQSAVDLIVHEFGPLRRRVLLERNYHDDERGDIVDRLTRVVAL
jgi:hypothetical protein